MFLFERLEGERGSPVVRRILYTGDFRWWLMDTDTHVSLLDTDTHVSLMDTDTHVSLLDTDTHVTDGYRYT